MRMDRSHLIIAAGICVVCADFDIQARFYPVIYT